MTEPLRVLLISRAGLVGTYQRKLEEIANRGVDLTVVVPPNWREPGRVQHLEHAHVQGYELAVEPMIANGSFHLHWYPRLARRMSTFDPQIVHVEEEPYNLATWHATRLARRRGARVVGFTWQNLARRYPQPFRAMQAHVLAHTDHFIAGSVEAEQVLRLKGYRGPTSIVPQVGIDPAEFAPDAVHRPHRPFTIGYAGRLVPEKGVDLLIRAASRLPDGARIAIIGSGPERERLIALARACGLEHRTTIEPWAASTAMPDWLRGLDVLVLPSRTRASWKEQFGRVLVEAMACGVPVIGAASGEIPHVIGGAGVVVAEDDVDGLTAALATLAGDPARRRALGDAGRARVLAHYTHARIATETIAVYRSVMEGAPVGDDRREP